MPHRRACAYCDSTQNLTREHVIPKFVCEQERLKGNTPQIWNAYTEQGDKAVAGEVTIADVCADCNNGPLSSLDSYGAQLWNKFFDRVPRPGEKVIFTYEFDLLLRWLLKLTYNAGRSRHWREGLLSVLHAYREYIIGKCGRPNRVRIYLQLITPEKLSSKDQQQLLADTGFVGDELPPEIRRFAVFVGEGIDAGFLVGLNGYQFYLVFWSANLERIQLVAGERAFMKMIKGSKSLPPESSRIVTFASSMSILDVARSNPILRRNIARGVSYMQQRNRRRR